jgi:phage terminase small subunit
MKTLTVRQRRFVEAYAGNATKAAIAAGYSPKTAHRIGAENMQKPAIMQAIQARETKAMRTHIADREQRQAFWTSVLQDTEQAMRDRLKASELLGKSEGDFLERVDLASSDGSMSPTVAIDLSHLTADEILALTRAAFDGEKPC